MLQSQITLWGSTLGSVGSPVYLDEQYRAELAKQKLMVLVLVAVVVAPSQALLKVLYLY